MRRRGLYHLKRHAAGVSRLRGELDHILRSNTQRDAQVQKDRGLSFPFIAPAHGGDGTAMPLYDGPLRVVQSLYFIQYLGGGSKRGREGPSIAA